MPTCSFAVCVTIFSTGGKFRPVSNFTESHTLTLATRSYALLPVVWHNIEIEAHNVDMALASLPGFLPCFAYWKQSTTGRGEGLREDKHDRQEVKTSSHRKSNPGHMVEWPILYQMWQSCESCDSHVTVCDSYVTVVWQSVTVMWQSVTVVWQSVTVMWQSDSLWQSCDSHVSRVMTGATVETLVENLVHYDHITHKPPILTKLSILYYVFISFSEYIQIGKLKPWGNIFGSHLSWLTDRLQLDQ